MSTRAGSKRRRSGPSSKPDKSQQTLMAAFGNTNPRSPALARRMSGNEDELHENLGQDLANVFGFYQEAINDTCMLKQQAVEREKKARSRNRRDSDEFDLHPDAARKLYTDADEYGLKFVGLFCRDMSRGMGCPDKTSRKHLVSIIGNHDLHQSKLLSYQAACALNQMNELYPPTAVKYGTEGQLRLEEYPNRWEPKSLERVRKWGNDTKDQRPFWSIMLVMLESACEALEESCNHKDLDADLLMLEQVVNVMAEDFRCRMEVFCANTHKPKKSDWPVHLLENSFLGRLIQEGQQIHRAQEFADLLHNLVQLVGATYPPEILSDEEDKAELPELDLIGRDRLRATAVELLQMILEFCGILEDTACFHRSQRRRYSTNLRMKADTDMFSAYNDELIDDEQKAAFLSVLLPRDRVRFICSIFARRRASRQKDAVNFPALVAASDTYDILSQEVSSFYDIDHLQVLNYVSSDMNFAAKVKGMECKDGLAMMISQLIHAASDCALSAENPASEMEKLRKAVETLVSAMSSDTWLSALGLAQLQLASITVDEALVSLKNGAGTS